MTFRGIVVVALILCWWWWRLTLCTIAQWSEGIYKCTFYWFTRHLELLLVFDYNSGLWSHFSNHIFWVKNINFLDNLILCWWRWWLTLYIVAKWSEGLYKCEIEECGVIKRLTQFTCGFSVANCIQIDYNIWNASFLKHTWLWLSCNSKIITSMFNSGQYPDSWLGTRSSACPEKGKQVKKLKTIITSSED